MTPRYATAASLTIARMDARSRSSHRRMLRMRRVCGWQLLPVLNESAGEKVAHQARDFFTPVFQREMSGVEQMQFGPREILEVRTCAVRREDHVVLAPDDQRRRLTLAEELLELRVQAQVRAVVVEQVELDLDIARAVQQRLIVQPGARIDPRAIGDAVEILRTRRLERGARAQYLALCLLTARPVRLDRL